MKPINEIVPQQGESVGDWMQSLRKTSKETGLPKHWVVALLKLLQAKYLNKFTSAIDGIEGLVVDEWSQVLDGLTPAQLRYGLSRLDGKGWPPTADEFKALCRGLDNRTKPALQKPWSSKETAAKGCESIRQVLKQAKGPESKRRYRCYE